MSDQKIQEDQYILPYHWSFDPDTFRGRSYHGYLKLVVNLAGNLSGKKVLDAGCGDGYLSHFLKTKGAVVTGIDYSDQAIRLAKNLVHNVDFQVIDLTKQSLEPTFDFIFLIEVLEHINTQDINLFLKNLSSGLKPGGKLILSVPSVNQPLIKKHYQHFSVQSLTGVINKADLKVDKIIGQENMSALLRLPYKVLDNRFWDLKLLRKLYNKKIYPKIQNESKIATAGRLIVQISR